MTDKPLDELLERLGALETPEWTDDVYRLAIAEIRRLQALTDEMADVIELYAFPGNFENRPKELEMWHMAKAVWAKYKAGKGDGT